MKNKSVRHKETNIFKFQPFSERIANVEIDIFHRVGHENENEKEEDSCFFRQAVRKWSSLNLTQNFRTFRQEVNHIVTLAQLCYDKENIVQVLLKYLRLKNSLSLQPLLELVIATCKDLRKDFYAYYPKFLEQLIDILNTIKDSDVLEWTFQCLAYLFKYLWRYMVKDINVVLQSLLPLLNSRRPYYVINFAAESFAFVARKVNDQKYFFMLIIKCVKNKPDISEGCARLLFEVINGVSKQFHSCANKYLPIYYESILENPDTSSLIFDILEHLTYNIVQNISSKHSKPFWTIIFDILSKTTNEDDIVNLLKLVGIAVEYKNCQFVAEVDVVIKDVQNVLLKQNTKAVYDVSSKIAAVLFLNLNQLAVAQELISSFVNTLIRTQFDDVFIDLSEKIHSCVLFDTLIFPVFLEKFANIQIGADEEMKRKCLNVLSNIIQLKSPFVTNGVEISRWKQYPLNFKDEFDAEKCFVNFLFPCDTECFEKALICVPHLVSENETNVLANKLELIVSHLIKILINDDGNLSEKDNQENKSQKDSDASANESGIMNFKSLSNQLKVFYHTTLALYQIKGNISQDLVQSSLKIAEKYASYQHIDALRLLDVVLTTSDAACVNLNVLNTLKRVLYKCLTSEYHEVRYITTHIFTLFEHHLSHLKLSEIDDNFHIFTFAFEIESIEPTIETYREQLRKLSHFHADKPQVKLCRLSDYHEFPLRFLLGFLYRNFQLLWKPVIEALSSLAHGWKTNEFWNVFYEQLLFNNEQIMKIAGDEDGCKLDKPDYNNYRVLLWNSMREFANVAEARNRDIVPMFLGFVESEFLFHEDVAILDVDDNEKINEDSERIDDENQHDNENQNDDENKNDDESTVEPIPNAEKAIQTKVKTTGKKNLKTLLAHLEVFAKFTSPKTAYQQAKLYETYLDLLLSNNSQIQKLALDCLLTYKQTYLTPYKDNLYAIIDDLKSKDELTLFRIDEQNDILLPEHRDNFMPIVLRIVYGKMQSRVGQRKGGKQSNQSKRATILRFLSNCKQNELVIFTKMSFKIYAQQITSNNLDELANNVTLNLVREDCLPIKRIQGALTMLAMFIEKFGAGNTETLLPYLLKILFVIGCYINATLKRDKFFRNYESQLKSLRSTCVQIITRFFDHYQQYPWTQQEIDFIFKLFLWPNLEKFATDGHQSPSNILKLFASWSRNPYYYTLLVKLNVETNNYPLKSIIDLYGNPKCHASVTNTILDIIYNLVTLTLEEDDDKLDPLPVGETFTTDRSLIDRLNSTELNFGSEIVLPLIKPILDRFESKLSSMSKNKVINNKELVILSHISELIFDSERCSTVLTLIVPMWVKKCQTADEDTVVKYVTTLENLIRNIDEPLKHLVDLAKLFCDVESAIARKQLLAILQIIHDKTPSFKHTCETIVDLNAYDAKWIDQPNFEKRLQAFRQIATFMETNEIDLNFGLLIIYTCLYLIHNEKDLALRDNAITTLKDVSVFLVKKYEKDKLNEVLVNILLNAIRNDLKSTKDDKEQERIRIAAIGWLGHLSRECSSAHVILNDLSRFTNARDLEVDVFENLQHLQLHRHGRALLKFAAVKDFDKKMNPRSLTQFVLPLVTRYLCCEKYSGKNAIVDAAIMAIGGVCEMLPWHQYELILRFYLDKLRRNYEYQKQLVRIVVAILDAFHFDLSRGGVINIEGLKQTLGENKKLKGDDEGKEIELNDELKMDDKNNDDNSDVNLDNKNDNVDLDIILDVNPEIDNEENELTELNTVENITEIHGAVVEPIKIDDNQTIDGTKNEISVQMNVEINKNIVILNPSTAKKVIFTISTILLPQLSRAIGQMTANEKSHKVNKRKISFEKEEEELLRVPIALAAVKLLQKLPVALLESNLPGIFMRICTFLRSHLESVRRTTREIMQKIMLTLGPKYLSVLLNEMTSLLTKGFQVHVLIYTAHAIITCLKDLYKPGDIDKCLQVILELCNADIFGVISEEKEIEQISRKTSEAKSTKSYDTFQVVAQFITDSCFTDLILPFKQILSETTSLKKVHKVEECLRRIVLGLIDNNFTASDSIVIFAYGIASENISEFKLFDVKLQKAVDTTKKPQQENCLIIPAEPKNRHGQLHENAVTSSASNAHILMEFGLKVFYFMVKREKLREIDYQSFIDPFVPILADCLKSKHTKLCTIAINCLSWIFKMELPTLTLKIKQITESLFMILHKYGAVGLSKGDNFDLVVASFKAMAILVRDVKYHMIDDGQLKTLLLYVEQDLHDNDRQATAFNLLKSILSRKLLAKEMLDVIMKVAEMSITSEMTHIRVQSRQIVLQFVMDYTLGKRLEKYLSFYTKQLAYPVQTGRESAIEMCKSFIQTFPPVVLSNYSAVFLTNLGTQLINESVGDCRKSIADCIKLLLTRLKPKRRDYLFEIVLTWFEAKNILHRQLAAQLCGIFVLVEKENFARRLNKVTRLLLAQLNGNFDTDVGKFVRVKREEVSQSKRTLNDHCLYQTFQTLLKLCKHVPQFMKHSQLENLAITAQTLLAHDHEWVRLAAAQFLGYVLSVIEPSKISNLILTETSGKHYLERRPSESIRSLALDLITQLQVGVDDEELVEQISKNLIFIARVLKDIPIDQNTNVNGKNENNEMNGDLNGGVDFTKSNGTIVQRRKNTDLMWLTRRMRKVVNAEVAQSPTSTILRTGFFKWASALALTLTRHELTPIAQHLLAPIVREQTIVTDNQEPNPLLNLAKIAGNHLKSKLTPDTYNQIISTLQMRLNIRRVERKRKHAMLAVNEPEVAAKKRLRAQERKKLAKKRKMDVMKGKVAGKRRKKFAEVDLERAIYGDDV